MDFLGKIFFIYKVVAAQRKEATIANISPMNMELE